MRQMSKFTENTKSFFSAAGKAIVSAADAMLTRQLSDLAYEIHRFDRTNDLLDPNDEKDRALLYAIYRLIDERETNALRANTEKYYI